MIGKTQAYKVVTSFGLFKIGQILNWDKAIARPYVARGILEVVERRPAPEVETATIDPGGEKAVKKRGRPRRRLKAKAVTNADT